MSQPGTTDIGINETWSFIKTLPAIRHMLLTFTNWFSSPTLEKFNHNESGELMRRYMARQSWFDKISYEWTHQSIFQKATIIIGITLFSGLVGVFFGAPTIIALSAGFIALTMHSLLVSHERKRQASAKNFAEEAIALNEDLRQSKKVLDEKIVALAKQVQELQQKNNNVNVQISLLTAENIKITQQNHELVAQTQRLKAETANLTEQQATAAVRFKQVSTQLEACSKEVVQTTTNVMTLKEVVSDFSKIVKDTRHSQVVLSQAANSFSLFVHEQAEQKIETTSEEDLSNDFLNYLLKQNEEDDALIDSIGLQK